MERLYQSARRYVNFFQPSFKLASKQRDGALVRRRYHPPLTPCQRLLASPVVDETVKHQLREQFAALDALALLKTIRDAQQELAALSDGRGQPPAQTSEDLSAFLDGLATAWQKIDRPPRGRRKSATKHWWRTRIDPFTHTWPLVERMAAGGTRPYGQSPDATGCVSSSRMYIPRLRNCAPLQRRVQLWRNEQVKRLIFASPSSLVAGSAAPPLNQNVEETTIHLEAKL